MIRDYKDLAIVRSQLALAEDALVSLHEGVYSKNPRNYAIFAESYIDMILQLRAEIDAFLGITPPVEAGPEENGTSGPDSPRPTPLPATEPVSH